MLWLSLLHSYQENSLSRCIKEPLEHHYIGVFPGAIWDFQAPRTLQLQLKGSRGSQKLGTKASILR